MFTVWIFFIVGILVWIEILNGTRYCIKKNAAYVPTFVHLEEEGLPVGVTNVHEMSDEEIDLWDLLFSESQRHGNGNWGFPMDICNHVSLDNYKVWRKHCEKRIELPGELIIPPIFWEIRDRYNVSMQDMARISEFHLTIDYELSQ